MPAFVVLAYGLRADAEPPPWLTFSSSATEMIGADYEVFLTAKEGKAADNHAFTAILTRHVLANPHSQDHTLVDEVSWTDNVACPQFSERLNALVILGSIHVEPPWKPKANYRILDADFYTLRTSGSYGDGAHPVDVSIKDYGPTPLADWVNKTMSAVKACWKSGHPTEH